MSEKVGVIDVEAIHHEGHPVEKIGSEVWGDEAILVVARETDDEEKSMSVREAMRKHRKAILWSLTISLCVIMEGYDTNLLGQFFAYREYSR